MLMQPHKKQEITSHDEYFVSYLTSSLQKTSISETNGKLQLLVGPEKHV